MNNTKIYASIRKTTHFEIQMKKKKNHCKLHRIKFINNNNTKTVFSNPLYKKMCFKTDI